MIDKVILNTVLGTYDVTQINNNFDTIERELNEKVLYRQNPLGSANQVKTDIDMNSHRLLNLPAPASDNEAARLKDVTNAVAGLSATVANMIHFDPTATNPATNVQGAIVNVDNAFREQQADREVSVFDFMTRDQIAEARAGTSAIDCTPAVQAAVDFCIAAFPAKTLVVHGLCYLASPVHINRVVDADAARDTFRIVAGTHGSGFIVNSAIPMFTSTITPDVVNGQPAPCTQNVSFERLTLTSTDKTLSAYVLDGNKFLRTSFNNCAISKLKLCNTTGYLQSIYINGGNIRHWDGQFIKATGGSYDVRINPGTLAEFGQDFLYLIDAAGLQSVSGNSVDGLCVEGLSGVAIRASHIRSLNVTNSYFEGNALGDIIMNDFPDTANLGVNIQGNMFSASAANSANAAYYSVVWGKTFGGSASGNFSDHNLHSVRTDTILTIGNDTATSNICNSPNKMNLSRLSFGAVSPAVDNAPYGNRAWAAGDRVYNTNFASLRVEGWVCVVPGTPGFWYPFGVVNADSVAYEFADNSGLVTAKIHTTDGGANESSLTLRYSDGATYKSSRVTIGAPDSGGAGFRALKVPN